VRVQWIVLWPKESLLIAAYMYQLFEHYVDRHLLLINVSL